MLQINWSVILFNVCLRVAAKIAFEIELIGE